MAELEKKFVAACQDLQNRNKRKWLDDFKSNPRALNVCHGLLLKSGVETVQFQCLIVIRDVVLATWRAIPKPQRNKIRSSLLNHVCKTHRRSDRAVVRQTLQLIVLCFKRDWLREGSDVVDDDAAKSLSSTLQHLGTSMNAPEDQILVAEMLSLVVQEFASSQSGPMNMPIQFHINCRRTFGSSKWLLRCLDVSLGMLQGLLKASATVFTHAKARAQALALLRTIDLALSWDHASAGDTQAAKLLSSPPAAWKSILLERHMLETFFRAYAMLGPGTKDGVSKDAAKVRHMVRQCLVQMASLRLSGPVFDTRLRRQHASVLVKGLVGMSTWTRVAESAGADSEEGAGMAELFHRVSLAFPLSLLCHVAEQPETKTVFKSAEMLTNNLLTSAARALAAEVQADIAASSSVSDLWQGDPIDLVIEMWAKWALAASDASTSGMTQHHRAAFAAHSHRVFGVYSRYCMRVKGLEAAQTLARMKQARPGASSLAQEHSDDQDRLKEQLDHVACLGRMDPRATLKTLHGFLSSSIQALDRLLAAPKCDVPAATSRCAEVDALLRLTAHLLADEYEVSADDISNEIPLRLVNFASSLPKGGPSPICVVSDLCLGVMRRVCRATEYHKAKQMQRLALVRLLLPAMLTFLQRWCAVYLFRGGSAEREALSGVRSAEGVGATSLRVIKTCSTLLTPYTGDRGKVLLGLALNTLRVALVFFPQDATCLSAALAIFKALTETQRIRRELPGVSEWSELVQGRRFGALTGGGALPWWRSQLLTLPGAPLSAHQSLSLGLLRATTALDPRSRQSYLQGMASGHLELLQKCGSSPSPLTLGVGARSISCLRGLVKAETEPKWAASEFVRSVGAIQKVFAFAVKSQRSVAPGQQREKLSRIVVLVLRLFSDVSECLLTAFSHDHQRAFTRAFVGITKVCVTAHGSADDKVCTEDLLDTLPVLLGTMQHMLAADDGGSSGAASMCSAFLQFVAPVAAPLVKGHDQYLQSPEVVEGYFQLIMRVCNDHPAQVLEVHPTCLQTLLHTLEGGLVMPQSAAVQRWSAVAVRMLGECLDGVATRLTKEQASRMRERHPSLPPALSRLCFKHILTPLLLNGEPSAIVPDAAAAVLATIVVGGVKRVDEYAQWLSQRAADADAKLQLAQCFTQLKAEVSKVHSNKSRPMRRLLRRKFSSFFGQLVTRLRTMLTRH